MDFRDILGVAGGLAGYYYGGDPTWAAGGAAAGRFAGGKIEREDTDRALKNSMIAGMVGYGAGKGLDSFGPNTIGSGLDTPSSGGGSGGSSGGGIFGGNMNKMLALGAASQIMGGNAAGKSAIDAQNRALETWRATAFPQSGVVESKRTDAVNTLNQQYQLAARKFSDDMSARGISPNSKVFSSQMLNIDMARRKAIAELTRKLIEFEQTPTQAAPIYNTTTQSSQERMANLISGITGTAYGLNLYKNAGQ